MSYVNKIQKNNVNYDIQDARIPQAAAADENKVIKVDSTGAYILGTGGGGGTTLYSHSYIIGWMDSETGDGEYAVVQFLDSASTAYLTISALMARIGDIDDTNYIPLNTKAARHCVRVAGEIAFDDTTYDISTDANLIAPYKIVSYDNGSTYNIYYPISYIDAETGEVFTELTEIDIDTAVWGIVADDIQAL